MQGQQSRDSAENEFGSIAIGAEPREQERSKNSRGGDARTPYRLLFEHSRDIVLLLEMDGKVADANQAATVAYGYSPPELTSKTIYDLRASPTSPLVRSQMTRANEDGVVFETVHQRKDGSAFPVEVSSRGVELDGRKFLLSVIRDVTDRKAAEAALAAERERYRMLFDQLVEAFAVHELILDEAGVPVDYRFIDANPAFERMTGLRREDIIGRTVRHLLPDLERHWIDSYARVAITGEVARFESYSESLKRHYEVVAFRPQVGWFATLFFDVTRSRQAEDERERLRAEESASKQRIQELGETASRRAAQLQSILDNMVDCVLVADRFEMLSMVNDAGARFFGTSNFGSDPVPLQAVPELLKARDLRGESLRAGDLPLSRALMGAIVKSMDIVIADPDSGHDLHTRTNASPIRNAEGEIIGAVAVMRDVTELTELDRLKDQFVSVAAHELKTPVAVINGYAQLLLRGDEVDSPNRRKHLEAINRGAARIDRLVSDLLEISQFQLGHVELNLTRFRIDDLLEETTLRFAQRERTHHLVVDALPRVMVNADRERVERVILTLLDNAVRYSPPGSEVTARLSAPQAGEVPETIVTIEDRGIGIPDDKQAMISNLFYRAHTNTAWDYGGMGVGLYLARETVSLHGGRIWFASVEGQGSSFQFSLPTEASD